MSQYVGRLNISPVQGALFFDYRYSRRLICLFYRATRKIVSVRYSSQCLQFVLIPRDIAALLPFDRRIGGWAIDIAHDARSQVDSC